MGPEDAGRQGRWGSLTGEAERRGEGPQRHVRLPLRRPCGDGGCGQAQLACQRAMAGAGLQRSGPSTRRPMRTLSQGSANTRECQNPAVAGCRLWTTSRTRTCRTTSFAATGISGCRRTSPGSTAGPRRMPVTTHGTRRRPAFGTAIPDFRPTTWACRRFSSAIWPTTTGRAVRRSSPSRPAGRRNSGAALERSRHPLG